MYERFQASLFRDGAEGRGCNQSLEFPQYDRFTGVQEFFIAFGGASFNRGLYRVLCPEEIDTWTDRICAAFPAFAGRMVPFGYDWLGRFFCLDLLRIQNLNPLVLLFNCFADQVLELPAGIVEFHNGVIIDQQEPALESAMFSGFLAATQLTSLHRSQCAELTVPLYLGGTYALENMKTVDLNSNWDVATQLLSQARNVPDGTPIKQVQVVQSKREEKPGHE